MAKPEKPGPAVTVVYEPPTWAPTPDWPYPYPPLVARRLVLVLLEARRVLGPEAGTGAAAPKSRRRRSP